MLAIRRRSFFLVYSLLAVATTTDQIPTLQCPSSGRTSFV